MLVLVATAEVGDGETGKCLCRTVVGADDLDVVDPVDEKPACRIYS